MNQLREQLIDAIRADRFLMTVDKDKLVRDIYDTDTQELPALIIELIEDAENFCTLPISYETLTILKRNLS